MTDLQNSCNVTGENTDVSTKTREDVEGLKYQWRCDPEWNIEETKGYEAHREELLAFRLKCEAEWEQEWFKRKAADEAKLAAEAANYEISVKAMRAINYLKSTLERLERKVDGVGVDHW